MYFYLKTWDNTLIPWRYILDTNDDHACNLGNSAIIIPTYWITVKCWIKSYVCYLGIHFVFFAEWCFRHSTCGYWDSVWPFKYGGELWDNFHWICKRQQCFYVVMPYNSFLLILINLMTKKYLFVS